MVNTNIDCKYLRNEVIQMISFMTVEQLEFVFTLLHQLRSVEEL